LYCAAPENIRTPPTEGIGISWGRGFEECIALKWNFQRGREVLRKISSMREEWIFSGSTHFPIRSFTPICLL